jgi:hypothetical protein
MPDNPPYPRTVLTFAPTGDGAHAAIAAATAKAAKDRIEPIDAKLCARLALLVNKAGGVAAAAKAAGVEEHALRVWLAGTYAPPLIEMARLAGAANLSLHWLATGDLTHGAPNGDAPQPPDPGGIAERADDAIKQYRAERKARPEATTITISDGTVTISGAARIVIGGAP